MWSPADLVILVPMLGRAHRVDPLLDSIHEATPTARVLFLLTPEDVDVIDAVNRVGAGKVLVPWRPCGDYSRKINEGYRATSEPLIFTGADDLRFHPGWFEACCRQLADGIGVVGTNDLTNKRTIGGDHSTHSLVTREYADRHGTHDGPGAILYEGYHHNFCDDELIATAQARGAYRHAVDAHVEHLHPMGSKAPQDHVYDLGQSQFATDRAHFRQRRKALRHTPRR